MVADLIGGQLDDALELPADAMCNRPDLDQESQRAIIAGGNHRPI